MSNTNDVRHDFEWHIHNSCLTEYGARLALKRDDHENYVTPWVFDRWVSWQAATTCAIKIERDRCAQLCETVQVGRSVKQGNFLVDWPVDSFGTHEGMTYAAVIRHGCDK